jgi:hypothetical protein
MTEQEVARNEKTLTRFLHKANKQFTYRVGLISLALLTEQFSPAQFEAFLSNCVDEATELQKHKNLNTNDVEDENDDQTAESPDQSNQNGDGSALVVGQPQAAANDGDQQA